MFGRVVHAGEEDYLAEEPAELDERARLHCLAVLQYLQDKGYVKALVALEGETGLCYNVGELPVASVLEGSLDMFAKYRAEGQRGSQSNAAALEAEEELQQLEQGVCCTGPRGGCLEPLNANVTAVAWAAAGHGEMVALAATSDRQLRLLGPDGEVLAAMQGLTSPLLSLDVSLSSHAGEVAALSQEVLATGMGGEVLLLKLFRPPMSNSRSLEGWALEPCQRFSHHAKHVNAGRFAPPPQEGLQTAHFVTVSRDHQAKLYARTSSEFSLACTVRLVGEVTCCCWVNDVTFVLAARDDHNLHYWDVSGDNNSPSERLKTNLNSLGDSVVSFAVLALAVSPNRRMLAACTDKSRVIVLQAFTARQLRNLYGATIDDYDVPSVCFSLDSSFIYTTSSLSAQSRRANDDTEEAAGPAMLGEVVIFEVRTGELVLKLPCHTKAVRCMHRHPQEEALVTGSFDRTVRYWS